MKDQRNGIQGVKIRTINYVMIAMACVLYVFVLFATFQTTRKYERMASNTDDYIASVKAAAMVQKGSDILTEQVRLYVVTADPKYAESYFQEANEDRLRERGLEILDGFAASVAVQEYLELALQHSYDLMERERQAMKLVATAQGGEAGRLPRDLLTVKLPEEDAALDAQAQLDKAREMVFDTGYQDAKALILSNIDFFLDRVLAGTEEAQSASMNALHSQLIWLQVCITVLFLMNILLFFFITTLIVKPLQVFIRNIRDNQALEVIGSYEFKYLAQTYNTIYEVKNANETMLRRRSERDSLTGAGNRSAFDHLRESMLYSKRPITLMLVDVDQFKLVNAQFGHETGDRVLQHVAGLLSSKFRATDMVFRIGGDEFAVTLINSTEKASLALAGKIDEINGRLRAGEDGIPPVSLSAGIATSLTGFEEKLYRMADAALCKVKENGRSGCAFFEEEMERGGA